MPHVSKRKVSDSVKKKADTQLFAALSEAPHKLRRALLSELLTSTERTMIAKRVLLLALIHRGTSIYRISKMLALSPSTVARYRVRVGQGKYPVAIRWVHKLHIDNPTLKFILEMLYVPYKAQRLTINEISKDW